MAQYSPTVAPYIPISSKHKARKLDRRPESEERLDAVENNRKKGGKKAQPDNKMYKLYTKH